MLQILPCKIEKSGTEPDLQKYFINNGGVAHFRGRRLEGEFINLKNYKGSLGQESFTQVLMWNHDTCGDHFSQILKVMDTLNSLNTN
jgi:hypothetical protein